MIGATEYSKAATRGDWGQVWTSFDQRKKGKPAISDDGASADSAAKADEGKDMFAGVE